MDSNAIEQSEPQPQVQSETLPHAQEQPTGHIEVKLPVLRESGLAKAFPLAEVFVSFPTAKANFLKSTMFYKIDFVWQGQEKSVTRRFSEIQNFREALQSLLPFSYLLPVHRKQLLVRSPELHRRVLPRRPHPGTQQLLQVPDRTPLPVQPQWADQTPSTSSSRRRPSRMSTRPSSTTTRWA